MDATTYSDGTGGSDRVLAGLRTAIGAVAGEDRSGWSGGARVDRAVELARWKDRLEAELLRAIGDADRDAAWQADGTLSATSWLAHEAPVSKPDAARLVRSARLARDCDRTGKVLAVGDVSVAHVDELARVARNREELFAEHEDALVDAASNLDPRRFSVVARRWALLADDQLATRDPYQRFQRRSLHVSPTFGGMVAIDGMLDSEGGARVLATLRSVDRPDSADGDLPPRSLGQRMADALIAICDGRTGQAGRLPPARAAIAVTTDADTLTGSFPADLTRARCDIEGAGPVAPTTIRRLACDAALTRMVMTPSQVLDVGKPTRVIPDHLRRAVTARDGGCVCASCDAPAAWCDVHHVVPRHRGGSTAEDNLVLLCRRHHVATHEGGRRLARRPDGWTTQPAERDDSRAPP